MKFRKSHDPCPRYSQKLTASLTDPLGYPIEVKSEFRNICDINYICEKIKRDGIAPVPMTVPAGVEPREGRFGDFSNGGDFQTVQDNILQAGVFFDSLPADVRNRFGSSAQFFDSINDPNIANYLEDRGILKNPQKPKKTSGKPSASAVPPAPSADPAPVDPK